MTRPPRIPLTPQLQQRIVELYATGLGLREVAQLTGASRSQVRDTADDAGVLRSRGGGRKAVLAGDEASRARALYRTGSTIRQVAAEFGVSYTVIRNLVTATGDVRQHGGAR